jgi:hypothetical protein
MNEDPYLEGIPEDELARFVAFRAKVEGTNISTKTLLATDYLNHFNEIIMMLEMLPDCPECIEEAKEWCPRTYQEHFQASSFKDKGLAIEAYDNVPSKFRQPFEQVIDQMNRVVAMTIKRFEAAMAEGVAPEAERPFVGEATALLHRMGDMASAVIHGSDKTLDQDEIDNVIGAEQA